jgi:hypothetical protein
MYTFFVCFAFFKKKHKKLTYFQKSADQAPMIHPTVRKFIGKAPPGTPALPNQSEVKREAPEENAQQTEFVSERIGIITPKVGFCSFSLFEADCHFVMKTCRDA